MNGKMSWRFADRLRWGRAAFAAAFFGCVCAGAGWFGTPLAAGEQAAGVNGAPIQPPPTDPFAEVLNNGSIEVVKTGPSCNFIKIQLPPGVTPEEIPGLATP